MLVHKPDNLVLHFRSAPLVGQLVGVNGAGCDAAWRQATLVTAGDFTGGANWDTLISWSDGRLIQYQDTGPSGGLGNEIQTAAPQSIRTHDTVMTAGAYDSNKWPDDLIIRWSDGETTLYTRTRTTFGDEHTLVQPA
ncbi:hypothetical protein [Streptomyces sp. NBC_00648]|uniref:hypothetical protein n=1 Tax=Streptomyces sp. NBC_00648 TaxID=2975797 RepID=UPI00324536D6